MSTNPGLTSRFPEVVDFRGLQPEECFTLLTSLIAMQKTKLKGKNVINMDVSSLEALSE
jgi:hypothetical protein